MAVTDVARKLTELLEPIAESHGFELVAVEQAGGRHTPVIRVLIDHPDGLSIDAICAANGWVSEALDAHDPFSGPYTLEVSSPGIDRPLRKLGDFERFTGETATIKTKPAGKGRSAWTGILLGIEGDSVLVDVDGERTSIPHADILKARLKGVISFDRGRDDQ